MYCDRLFDYLFLLSKHDGGEKERPQRFVWDTLCFAELKEKQKEKKKPETEWMLKKTYIKKYNL